METISLNDYYERRKPEVLKPRRQLPEPRLFGGAAVAVLLIIISFYGGTQYQKSYSTKARTATSNTKVSNPTNGRGGFGGGFRRGRAVGTVSSVSSNSITIQTRSGSSKTYTITSRTTVTNKGQAGSVSDIQTGDTVLLTLDSSNTQNIKAIDLNPSFSAPPTSSNGQSTTNNGSSSSNDNSSLSGA